MKLARGTWHQKFREREVATEAEKQARILERRMTGTRYCP